MGGMNLAWTIAGMRQSKSLASRGRRRTLLDSGISLTHSGTSLAFLQSEEIHHGKRVG
jgi:hypothetical protein